MFTWKSSENIWINDTLQRLETGWWVRKWLWSSLPSKGVWGFCSWDQNNLEMGDPYVTKRMGPLHISGGGFLLVFVSHLRPEFMNKLLDASAALSLVFLSPDSPRSFSVHHYCEIYSGLGKRWVDNAGLWSNLHPVSSGISIHYVSLELLPHFQSSFPFPRQRKPQTCFLITVMSRINKILSISSIA